MVYYRLWLFAVMVFSAILVTGCTLARRSQRYMAPESKEVVLPSGQGDAFLYDLKIYRHGKKNTVRLDVYRTDDSIALFARGYLGKGVLKGIIHQDSIVVFFPTENEFYSGSIAALIDDPCTAGTAFEKLLLNLFRRLPSDIETGLDDFFITVLEKNRRGRKFRLTSKSCSQTFELEYDYRDERYLPLEFEFDINPDDLEKSPLRFMAKRREQKLNIAIPEKKFNLTLPATAIPIIP